MLFIFSLFGEIFANIFLYFIQFIACIGNVFKYQSIDFALLGYKLSDVLPWFAIGIACLCGMFSFGKYIKTRGDGTDKESEIIGHWKEIYKTSYPNKDRKQSKQKRK